LVFVCSVLCRVRLSYAAQCTTHTHTHTHIHTQTHTHTLLVFVC